jgi:hypothetical protein
MQRVELNNASTGATKVWSVKEFAKRQRIDETQEAHLLKLFGPYATAFELLHNANREPRWR